MSGGGKIDSNQNIQQDSSLSPFDLFMEFAPSSNLMKQKAADRKVRNGAKAGKMDLPLYRYLFSIGFHINRTNEVYDQIQVGTKGQLTRLRPASHRQGSLVHTGQKCN